MEHTGNILQETALIIGGVTVSVLELVIAAIIGGGVFLAMRDRARREAGESADAETLKAAVDAVAQAQTAMDARVMALTETAATGQDTLRRAVDDRLDAVTKRLGDGLAETQRRTGDALRQLHERLALIDRAQENIKELSGEVTSLQALLSNKQRRGAFGEIQMQDLVKTFLPSSAYAFQETLSNRARVDCLIKLPNPPGPVAVDSKFPLEPFIAYSEAEDAAEREQAARTFKAAVLTHVKAIAEKYLLPGETADTALMFVPSEAVYAAIHADFPDLVERGFKARVMIVSPTTFMATLHTMRAVMRDARLRAQAHVIQREVGSLADDVARLDDRVAKLQRHFDQAGEDVRQIRISTEKVVRRAQRIDEVHVSDEEADALAAANPAAITAAE